MKSHLITITLIALIAVVFALNFHLIHTEDGFEILAKDHLSFRDTYVDVRNWNLEDYFVHSERIRNYLLYTKQYLPLKQAIQEKSAEYSQKAKEALRPIEQLIHEWLSEKLGGQTSE